VCSYYIWHSYRREPRSVSSVRLLLTELNESQKVKAPSLKADRTVSDKRIELIVKSMLIGNQRLTYLIVVATSQLVTGQLVT